MNNVPVIREADLHLAWAKKMAEPKLWEFRMPGARQVIMDSHGILNAIKPTGELIVFEQHNNQIVQPPTVIYGDHDEALLERHFSWVPAGLEQKQCMLWRMLNLIKVPALRSFYHSVLIDDDIMLPFYRAKASHHHHHDYEGGLFEHSFEVATTAASMARQYNLGHATVCISYLAGLVHDLGKIRMYYNDQDAGVCGQHESYTFMVLSRPLESLRRLAPNLFEALSSAISVKTSRHQSQYLPETIVRMCDQLSAEVAQCRKAFAGMPDYFWYAKAAQENRVYKRLPC